MKKGKVYIIWDTRKNEQWSSGAKAFWKTAGAAKNALLLRESISNSSLDEYSGIDKKGQSKYPNKYTTEELDPDWIENGSHSIRFVDQSRYECWECDIVKNKMV